MIILPDKNIIRTKFLQPIPNFYWKEPSIALLKDEFGNPNATYFRIRAKTHDGIIIWTGRFRDRFDFDAFLWAMVKGSLNQEKELWRLPNPWYPGLDPDLIYDFATETFLTSGSSYSVPTDWNNGNNSIEAIGGGASGGASVATTGNGTGGGGGAYAKITNQTHSGSVSYTIGSGGAAAAAASSASPTNGNDGNDTTWNTSTCIADSGKAGLYSTSGSAVAGGAGGTVAGSTGETKYAGGNGGASLDTGAGNHGFGGGGAAGPNGAGNQGEDHSGAYNGATPGGSGDAGFGGTGGEGGTQISNNNLTGMGGTGGNGTEWDATPYGSGGGGGGMGNNGSANVTGGDGGLYGAGGGGAQQDSGGPATSGAGKQGLIVITYEPLKIGSFNMPMLGL